MLSSTPTSASTALSHNRGAPHCVRQVVPLVYYPLFFSLTGLVQGLSANESLARAREKFLPLIGRNLQFWLPVQIIQFQYVPEDLQARLRANRSTACAYRRRWRSCRWLSGRRASRLLSLVLTRARSSVLSPVRCRSHGSRRLALSGRSFFRHSLAMLRRAPLALMMPKSASCPSSLRVWRGRWFLGLSPARRPRPPLRPTSPRLLRAHVPLQ